MTLTKLQKPTIAMIGLGYIGIPTALLLAQNGHKVIGVDIDEKKIELLQKNILPFKEKGLMELYHSSKNNFFPTSSFKDIQNAQVYIIAVPTPITPEKFCDLRYVKSACKSVSEMLEKGDLVVIESTITPSITKNTLRLILEESGLICGQEFSLAYVSEKAIPVDTLKEMQENTRVIGGIDRFSTQYAKKVYSSFVKGEIIETDCTTAEAVKLFENTYRDVNIALANEFLKLSKEFNLNVWEVVSIANHHPRVNIHTPGPGVGGHCIPIDPWFLTIAKETKIIETARKINDSMPKEVVNFVEKNVSPSKIIAILGISYKENIDDTRESPGLIIGQLLEISGYKVIYCDPYASNTTIEIVPLDTAIQLADTAIIITAHKEYKDILFKIEENKTFSSNYCSINKIIDTKKCIILKPNNSTKNPEILTFGDYKK